MNVAVIGAGSWGTALAAHLARCTHAVRLWARDADLAREIDVRHENSRYLAGVTLPALRATRDLADALRDAEMAIVAVPSEFFRATIRALRPHLGAGTTLVSATKGLELGTLLRMSEVAAAEAPGHPVAVLSGPSFALEVAQGQPTTVVIAASTIAVAEAVQRAVSSRTFRAYSSDDVIGVELGGALKNVIAIAAGIVDGLGYGHNTVAALITRGLAEMSRLAVALGARPDTLAGLAGLGDLVLTCTGALSRNRRLGHALGAGHSVGEALAELHMVAEGVRTTQAACALAERAGVEMPIAQQMRAVLYEGKPPREGVDALMLRSLKRE
ncbi:MAG TPA: NAD(P)H-dependent glycerol-3-phosphate dehydrogenase [Anaeromyxobacter sp.]